MKDKNYFGNYEFKISLKLIFSKERDFKIIKSDHWVRKCQMIYLL